MNDVHSERTRPWDLYTSINPSSSETMPEKEVAWRNFGTSMNAISFGFVATAILISMFLIMAIFEHLLRPRSALAPIRDGEGVSMEAGTLPARNHLLEKLGHCQPAVGSSYSSDFSVLMPGQQYPTFIAQPAPLACPREGIHWPSHVHGSQPSRST